MKQTRREALAFLGVAGALLWVGCGDTGATGDDAGATGTPDAGPRTADAGSTTSCVLDPNVTKGPYWIDERLDRSDITSDSNGVASPNPRPGLPLDLVLTIFAYDAGTCTPLAGAQVDIWHCDGSGIYSGVANTSGQSTVGQNFLRGYQTTGADGVARFTKIGRAHV